VLVQDVRSVSLWCLNE